MTNSGVKKTPNERETRNSRLTGHHRVYSRRSKRKARAEKQRYNGATVVVGNSVPFLASRAAQFSRRSIFSAAAAADGRAFAATERPSRAPPTPCASLHAPPTPCASLYAPLTPTVSLRVPPTPSVSLRVPARPADTPDDHARTWPCPVVAPPGGSRVGDGSGQGYHIDCRQQWCAARRKERRRRDARE